MRPRGSGDAARGGADDDRVGGDGGREEKRGRWDETWMLVLLRVVVVGRWTDGRTDGWMSRRSSVVDARTYMNGTNERKIHTSTGRRRAVRQTQTVYRLRGDGFG